LRPLKLLGILRSLVGQKGPETMLPMGARATFVLEFPRKVLRPLKPVDVQRSLVCQKGPETMLPMGARATFLPEFPRKVLRPLKPVMFSARRFAKKDQKQWFQWELTPPLLRSFHEKFCDL
jgi:hypothetical protein